MDFSLTQSEKRAGRIRSLISAKLRPCQCVVFFFLVVNAGGHARADGILIILVMMVVLMLMSLILVRMWLSVDRAMSMHVLVAMLMREMHVEFDSFDGRFVSARYVQMVTAEFQLFQFVLQFMRIHAQIEQRAYEHVAADAAEDIEI